MAKQTVEIEFIETEAAYRRALKRLAIFFDAPPKAGGRDDTEFRLLMLMVEKYEAGKYAVPPPGSSSRNLLRCRAARISNGRLANRTRLPPARS